MTERIRAVIFDCDGVLVDSEDIANTVLASVLTDAGIPMTVGEVMAEFRGRHMAFILSSVEQKLGSPPPFDVAARYYDETKRRFRDELEPLPGVAEALEAIDLPDCVASSGPHHKMEVTLRVTGLWDHFAGRIFSAEDVGVGKPAPDLFLHAAEVMGFEPSSTAVVEDSLLGIEAALAAGMIPFGLTGHFDAETMASAGATPFAHMALLPGLLSGDRDRPDGPHHE